MGVSVNWGSARMGLSTDPASVGERLNAINRLSLESVSTGPVPVGPTTES